MTTIGDLGRFLEVVSVDRGSSSVRLVIVLTRKGWEAEVGTRNWWSQTRGANIGECLDTLEQRAPSSCREGA